MTPFQYECEFQALISEREGLIAENQNRIACGDSTAYPESRFQELAARFRQLGIDCKEECSREELPF
jgi:hypothetical protein